ncbi:hypothetical protein Pyrfu_1415 [Pyrolobus fumarii 1A]|uniref:Uncharacterized protein n=1 Tax=Pyrolobus fumarii (strain DSM 11204 / 1A) TaxID=694429 RepID=G0EH49_PYRF1|nr:hypothetical protein [Pyrolobus fumarii]AEM39273.1 hypothetical protein Pyrfu_1415 [Pyrolobus fumarii 1A]
MAIRLGALILLSTMAYLDFSLVILRLRGTLDFAHPVVLLLTGLFFVSGPGSWLAALNVKSRTGRAVCLILGFGLVAALYAATLTTMVEEKLGMQPSTLLILTLPGGISIALIGLLELATRPDVKPRLEALYARVSAGLPPYALLTLASIVALYSFVVSDLPGLVTGLTVYTLSLYMYARCSKAERTLLHILTLAPMAALLYIIMSSVGASLWRTTTAELMLLGVYIASMACGACRSTKSDECSLIPLLGAAIAVMVGSSTALLNVPLTRLLDNLAIYITVGVIGWSVNTSFLLLGSRASKLVETIALAPETRMAAGLALLSVGLETAGLAHSHLTLALVAGGAVAALLNTALRGQEAEV